MSSHSPNQAHPPSSSQFLPPQSAQPYRSIFGGPSSDAGPLPSSQPELPRKSIFGGSSSNVRPKLETLNGGQDYDEFEALMQERPLEADYNSEGESFQGSLDGEDGLGLESEPDLPRKIKSRTASSSPSKTVPTTEYFLDRGLDLLPGSRRPNRWDGAPRTYRNLISDERRAYESILANRSTDLAAHLYDSFALRNKKIGESLGSDDESEDPAAVKKVWVGWPMLADDVPRSDEYIRRQLDDPDTYRMAPDPRPSADLEECIIASMLKTAKETFRSRDWDTEEVRTQRGRSREVSEPKMDTDEDEMKHESESGMSVDQESFRPVFQADEDKSRKQLRPLSRNVITQLDQVLMGLHHAMQGRTRSHHAANENESDTEAETSRSRSREPSASGAEQRSRSRQRASNPSRSRSHNQETSDEDEDKRDASQSRGRQRKARRYVFQRGEQRDWSDVLGIAAMTGLPSDAVIRASKRCADLFEQDMEFRRFHEGRIHRIEFGRKGKSRKEYIESDTDGDNIPKRSTRGRKKKGKRVYDSDEERPPAVSQPKGKGEHRKADIVCPITTCPRHRQGFSRTWNLTLHLRNAHGREREQNSSEQRSAVVQLD